MKIKFNCELVAIIPVAFESSVGETVEYKEVYLVNENDEGRLEMLKFNTKVVLDPIAVAELASGNINKVDIEVEVDNNGERKPKLLSLKK